jgi:hypothetical protein
MLVIVNFEIYKCGCGIVVSINGSFCPQIIMVFMLKLFVRCAMSIFVVIKNFLIFSQCHSCVKCAFEINKWLLVIIVVFSIAERSYHNVFVR